MSDFCVTLVLKTNITLQRELLLFSTLQAINSNNIAQTLDPENS